MPPKLVFDVTMLLRLSARRPSGIQRVQLEAACMLARLPAADVAFCAFDRDRRVYEPVDASRVLEAATRMRGRPHPPAPPKLRRLLRGRIEQAAARALATSPAALGHLRRSASHARRAVVEALDVAAALRREHRREATVCFSQTWSSETTYCSVGVDWIDGDLEYLAERRLRVGFRTVLAVYDLTPAEMPQYHRVHPVPDFAQTLRTADVLLVVSESTAEDLRTFARRRALPVPPLVRLPLGSALVEETPTVPAPMRSPGGREPDRFVLCVGTIEPRKNHPLLLDVWEMLLTEQAPDAVPMLVVAGHRGWLATETMSRLTRTPGFGGVLQFLEQPSDGELAWLYRNCAFTVYPALYEGWGLPVSESLDFGKLCLTSNRSSLPEAGEGLTDLLDPFDRLLWRDRIMSYWNDRDLLRAREREIERLHRHVSPDETARAVLESAGVPWTAHE
jgi:glycosyltransferase involved in cell wall biosynthesis